MLTVMWKNKTLLAAALFLPRLAAAEPQDQCLLEQLRSATENTTVAQLREACRAGSLSVTPAPAMQTLGEHAAANPAEQQPATVENRLSREMQAFDNPYAITTHRPNYFIFAYQFDKPNDTPYNQAFPADNISFRNAEAKFQLSLKFPLALNLFDDNMDLMAGYTNRSFWQVFNHHLSAPFRETNHQPEIWLRWRTDVERDGWTARVFNVGLEHQSNGQSGLLSRSWNRVYTAAVAERENVALGLRLSKRIPEKMSSDDNQDIEKFIGGVEFTAVHHAGNHVSSVMFRIAPDTGKSALQLDYSYPFYKNLRGYIQYYDGFGESLIDYNYHSRSLGFGIQLGGWL